MQYERDEDPRPADKDDSAKRDIVLVGASMGGVDAVRTLVGSLPPDFGAPVMVVIHTTPNRPSLLADILQKVTQIPVAFAVDGERFVRNRIYVAVPGRHLMIEGDHLRVTRGPRESRARPAVDVLFRSAAYHHGPRVIGVVLTGNLDDGTAGLWAIKDRGGVAVVQPPDEAQCPSMPANALQNVEVDYVTPIREMAALLQGLIREGVPEKRAKPMPDDKYAIETQIALEKNALAAGVRTLGTQSFYTCPDCHGSLVLIEEGPIKRYRCHTGHAYSPRALHDSGIEQVEKSVWSTVAHLEELEVLLAEMEQTLRAAGDEEGANAHRLQQEEIRPVIERARSLALDPIFTGSNLQ